jgi:hypothetical protein
MIKGRRSLLARRITLVGLLSGEVTYGGCKNVVDVPREFDVDRLYLPYPRTMTRMRF